MESHYKESLPDVLPFVDSFDESQLDKRALEPKWEELDTKKFDFEDTKATTPAPKQEGLKETTPCSVFSLPGPAGNPDYFSSQGLFGLLHDGSVDDPTLKFWKSTLNSVNDYDVDMERYPDYDKSKSIGPFLAEKFNIRKIIKTKHERVFRVDFLIAMIDSLLVLEPNILVTLADETGKIKSIIYKEDVDMYRNQLVVGRIIILVEIMVYCPIGCDPYVIISGDSISRIVPNYEAEDNDIK